MSVKNNRPRKFVPNEALEGLEAISEPPLDIQRTIKTIEERDVFYMYNSAFNILNEELAPLFRGAFQNANNRGRILFLYGDNDTGKSYLIDFASFLFETKYPEIYADGKIPFHIIEIKDNINTAEQLLLYLLDKLGRTVDPKQLKTWSSTGVQLSRMQENVIKALEEYQTRILILDECQRFITTKNPDVPNIFETFKDLTTKSNWSGNFRTNFILTGTHDGLPLLDAHDMIQGRTHTVILPAISRDEYGVFLWRIYEDFVSNGISEDWELVIWSEEEKDYVINHEIAEFLYERSKGKAGLTVELIRDATKRALNNGRLFPEKKDYKVVILDGRSYEFDPETEDFKTIEGSIDANSKPIEIIFDFNDLKCKYPLCKHQKALVGYKTPRSLINHYKMKHPSVIVKNKAGKRMFGALG